MGRIMQALPSFLTPPRSNKHQTYDFQNAADDESPHDIRRKDIPPPMTPRERRRAQNNNGGVAVGPLLVTRKSSRGQPPNAFVMPYERERPSSSSVATDRPKSPPPGYNRGNDNRRQTWAPGSRGAEDNNSPEGHMNGVMPAEAQPVMRTLDDYKTILKEWKKHHTVFMSGFQEIYLPALERCFARISPEFEAALQPLCGPQELRICMRHWEQETKRFSSAGLTCANTTKGLARDAWNEVVVLDEQATDGQMMMNKLRMDMDIAYDIYLKALETSKENLWHTLDFNVDGNQDLKYEVRGSFWGLFDKLQVIKEEHPCGLAILTIPDLEHNGNRRADPTAARYR